MTKLFLASTTLKSRRSNYAKGIHANITLAVDRPIRMDRLTYGEDSGLPYRLRGQRHPVEITLDNKILPELWLRISSALFRDAILITSDISQIR